MYISNVWIKYITYKIDKYDINDKSVKYLIAKMLIIWMIIPSICNNKY